MLTFLKIQIFFFFKWFTVKAFKPKMQTCKKTIFFTQARVEQKKLPKKCVNCQISEFATKQRKIETGWKMREE